ncbi:hypothetical protein ACIBKY_10055 [Nonomuraea sp. NPDC050394]|uniref:hypothetical protein n=1 Tax=Nonomuraea sp. NPDC050394 TaxID=3364363 RepID=UPI003796CC45
MRISWVMAGVAVAGVLTAQAAVAESRSIPKNFLLYEKQARQDVGNEHWYVNEGEGREPAEVNNIQCSNARLKGWIDRRDVTFNPKNDGNEKTHSSRGEQVFLFAGIPGAEKMIKQMHERMARCEGVKVVLPAIGDGAVGGSRTVVQAGAVAQVQKSVAVRKGAAVALYWDLRNDAKALRTLARHGKDAERMAARLCRIGGC